MALHTALKTKMAAEFVHNFCGLKVHISLSPSSNEMTTSLLSGFRLSEDRIEVDVTNFSGTIVLSRNDADTTNSTIDQPLLMQREKCVTFEEHGIVVDAIPEEATCQQQQLHQEENGAGKFGPALLSTTINTDDDNIATTIENIGSKTKNQSPNLQTSYIRCGSVFASSASDWVAASDVLRFHEECAYTTYLNINTLCAMLKANPKLASIPDDDGNYPVHIFASNESIVHTVAESNSNQQVEEFISELYSAFPLPFYGDVHDMPFAGIILEWIGRYQQQCTIESEDRSILNAKEVAKELTMRLREASSLSVEEDIKSLKLISSKVSVTPQLVHSIKMLSVIIDNIVQSAYEASRGDVDIIFGNKGREDIIGNIASIPYLLRTILLIDDKDDRYELLHSSLIQHVLLNPESVGQWVITMICGNSNARKSFVVYLKLVSSMSLSKTLGIEKRWSPSSLGFFHREQIHLFERMGKVEMFVPCMVCLGEDLLLEAAPTKAVVYQIDKILGDPLAVSMIYNDTILHVILMISYRAILVLVYSPLIPTPSKDYGEYFFLGMTILSYFTVRDISTLIATAVSSKYVLRGYFTHIHNFVNWACIGTLIPLLVLLYQNNEFYGPNFMGIAAALLWLKLLGHIRGMNENVATLLYTVLRINRKIVPFLFILVFLLFMFGDVIEIISKFSGRCESGIDADDDSNFCSANSVDHYILMYSFLITGIEFPVLYNASTFVRFLLISFTYVGIIVLINVLIAIVTDCYSESRQLSHTLFERSRLELAARHAARTRFLHPPRSSSTGRIHFCIRSIIKGMLIASFVSVEIILFHAIAAGFDLSGEGVLGMHLTIFLIICTVALNISLTVLGLLLFSGAIEKYTNVGSSPWVIRLKERNSCIFLTKICLFPLKVCLSIVGLGIKEYDE